jgi:predicted metal-dependent hydrolase
VQFQLPFLQTNDQATPAEPTPTAAPPFAIEFVRVRRARRYILRVRQDGTLRVTVPRGGSRREAEQFVRKHEIWIARERTRVRVESPAEWADGTTILVGGQSVRITVESQRRGWRVLYGDRSVAVRDPGDVRRAVEADLREVARVVLLPRLRALASSHGLELGTVTIRNQRSRWGSCARNGNIALNFRLVQMPPHVSDYVLLHELMHIKQQNHSRRFWRLVESACPGFRDAERWLRTTGRTLF